MKTHGRERQRRATTLERAVRAARAGAGQDRLDHIVDLLRSGAAGRVDPAAAAGPALEGGGAETHTTLLLGRPGVSRPEMGHVPLLEGWVTSL